MNKHEINPDDDDHINTWLYSKNIFGWLIRVFLRIGYRKICIINFHGYQMEHEREVGYDHWD